MFTFSESEKAVKKYIDEIVKEQFDLMVIPLRGALIPARLILEYASIKDFMFLNIEHIHNNKVIMPEFRELNIIDLTNNNVKPSKVLIVDDVNGSGSTIYSIKKFLNNKFGEGIIIKSFVLVQHQNTKYEADWCGKIIGDEWMQFQWEEF